MKFLTREQVFDRMRQKGHIIFENDSRNHNLNIIGIRSKTAKVDEFGCQLMVAWKFRGQWHDRSWAITTYPGKTYLIQRLLNPAGCAILAEGQYLNTYKIDYHRGEYKALCQRLGPVAVFRDKNKDYKFDLDKKTLMHGMFGINIHNSRDNMRTTRVGSHSAGCQVFQDDKDFESFMELCFRAERAFGNRFTYTLISE